VAGFGGGVFQTFTRSDQSFLSSPDENSVEKVETTNNGTTKRQELVRLL
jgi:hypothetical protein